MTRWRQLMWGANGLCATLLIGSMTFVFQPIVPAYGQDTIWTGEGENNRWDNPDNWDVGEVPETGNVYVTEVDGGGPIIDDGIDATAGVLIAVIGESEMSMTGGSLELTGWGAWWADEVDTVAQFNMSGGEIFFTGSPGIMELAWQPQGTEPGSSVGIWNMTGGEINALGIDMPGKGYGGTAEIHLDGGIINVGTSRGGLVMYDGGLIDITAGVMSLEGDQVSRVDEYIGEGWITAYDGMGEVLIDFDGDVTTLMGVSNLLDGDYNQNGMIDAGDLDVHAEYMATNDLAGDLNNDGITNTDDRIEWILTVHGSYVGDSNFDGKFDPDDLIEVFSAGKYDTGERATYATGDWDGNFLFESDDLLFAFAEGGYNAAGPAVAEVPEPTSMVWAVFAMLPLVRWRHQRRTQVR